MTKTRFRQDELAYWDLYFKDKNGNYVWPEKFSADIYDSEGNLQTTVAENGDVSYSQKTDPNGHKCIHISKIPIDNYSEGVVTIKSKVTIDGLSKEVSEPAFEVSFYTPINSIGVDSMVRKVRRFLRDHKELNELLGDYESTDESIKEAIREAISDYNTEPPLIESISLNSFPSGADGILVLGASYHILNSVLNWRAREGLPFSDGKMNMDPIGGPANAQNNRLQTLYQIYKDRLRRFKMLRNIDSMYDSVEWLYDTWFYF